jgi:hypothetical protein
MPEWKFIESRVLNKQFFGGKVIAARHKQQTTINFFASLTKLALYLKYFFLLFLPMCKPFLKLPYSVFYLQQFEMMCNALLQWFLVPQIFAWRRCASFAKENLLPTANLDIAMHHCDRDAFELEFFGFLFKVTRKAARIKIHELLRSQRQMWNLHKFMW